MLAVRPSGNARLLQSICSPRIVRMHPCVYHLQEASDITFIKGQTAFKCTFPPIPEGAAAGALMRLWALVMFLLCGHGFLGVCGRDKPVFVSSTGWLSLAGSICKLKYASCRRAASDARHHRGHPLHHTCIAGVLPAGWSPR